MMRLHIFNFHMRCVNWCWVTLNFNYLDTKIRRHIWHINQKQHFRKKEKKILRTAKHGAGRVMVWGRFAAADPEQKFHFILEEKSETFCKEIKAEAELESKTRSWYHLEISNLESNVKKRLTFIFLSANKLLFVQRERIRIDICGKMC